MDGGSIPPSSTKDDISLTAAPGVGTRSVRSTRRSASIVIEATAASTNSRIWTGDFTADDATTELHRWLLLHAVRTLAGLAAVIASYRAISAGRDERSGAAAAAPAV